MTFAHQGAPEAAPHALVVHETFVVVPNGEKAPMMPDSSSRIDRQLHAILARLFDDRDSLREAFRTVDDWSALLLAAHEQGIAGVVLAGAKRAQVGPSPVALEEATRRLRLGVVWRDVLHDALRAVILALMARGVAAVALKGPVLAMRLYDDEAVRPSADLDLLVAPTSLDAAVSALQPLGYQLEGGRIGRFFRQHHHHVHLFHDRLPTLELHFEAYRGFGTTLPAAPLLARSMPCGVPEWGEIRVLAPEEEFVYLAVHAASHRFRSLVWLLDLKLLALRHPDMRWDHLAKVAAAHRLSTAVSFACTLLFRWLGAPLYGLNHLPPLSDARANVATYLSRPQSIHVANATASFLFSALLCDDGGQAAAYAGRFLRIKVHEASLRARELLAG